jgi:excisionase family DNA binding protein
LVRLQQLHGVTDANHFLDTMNPQIKQLFSDYRQITDNKVVAALLVLADVLCQSTSELVVIEPDDKNTVSVKEAANRLGISSKDIYQRCLAGRLRCIRVDGRVRVLCSEVERVEAGL